MFYVTEIIEKELGNGRTWRSVKLVFQSKNGEVIVIFDNNRGYDEKLTHVTVTDDDGTEILNPTINDLLESIAGLLNYTITVPKPFKKLTN